MFITNLLSRSGAVRGQWLERDEKAALGCRSQILQSDKPGGNILLSGYRTFPPPFTYFQIRWQQGVRTKFPPFMKYETGALTQTSEESCGCRQDRVRTRHCCWGEYNLKGNNCWAFQCAQLRVAFYFRYLNTDLQIFWRKYGIKP